MTTDVNTTVDDEVDKRLFKLGCQPKLMGKMSERHFGPNKKSIWGSFRSSFDRPSQLPPSSVGFETMTIEEHSEQSYTEIGNYDTVNDAEDHSLVDTRTGDFTETYREELLRTPDADKDAKQMEKLIRRQAKRVQKGRRLFATCILIVGVLVVAGAFLSLSKLEKTESTEKVSMETKLDCVAPAK
jgi:hypothetical protein